MSQPHNPGNVEDQSPCRIDVSIKPLPPSSHQDTLNQTIPASRLLEMALAKQLPSMPWVGPVSVDDQELDTFQQDAVARAIATPDFLVIQGPSGTGKTRTLIEIAHQLTKRHQRVLWLLHHGQDHKALVVAIERRLPIDGLCVLLTDFPENHPAHPKHVATVCQQQLDNEYDARTVSFNQQRLQLQSTLVLTRDWLHLQEQYTTTRHQIDQPVDVSAIDEQLTLSQNSFAAELAKLQEEHQQRLNALQVELSQYQSSHDDAQKELADLQPKVAVAKSGSIFSPSTWLAKLDGSLLTRYQSAESKCAECNTKQQELTQQIAEQQAKFAQQTAEYSHRQAELVAQFHQQKTDQINQVRSPLQITLADIQQRQEQLRQQLSNLSVSVETIHPETPANVESQLAELENQLATHETKRHETANEVVNAIDRWKRSARLTISAVTNLADLGNQHFDVLMIDHAEHLTDAEQKACMPVATRWIFAGEPPEKHLRANHQRPEWWGRLWHALYYPRTWVHEGAHFVCRLHPLTAAERRKCDREPVADNPDVELRVSIQHDEPLLAEVAFPVQYPVASAREFLIQELQETMLQPATHSPSWEHTADRFTCRFVPTSPITVVASIGRGITEEVIDLETAAVHFRLADGWTAESASQWMNERALNRTTSRAVALHRSHRACPGLAVWLNEAFRLGYTIPTVQAGEHHVEFLAVPDLRNRREPSHARPTRTGGAGYEISLADTKQRSLLADDLAQRLPNQGFVNLAEAQAIVQYLEGHSATLGTVRVSSPFPQQVMVLKYLLAKSRVPHVAVLEHDDFDRAEVDLLIISLTRSHVSRAVTFGESPAIMRQLVSTARRRILFAGDPGTLSRRLQWEGPVDHLDATEASHERSWVSALAICPRVNLSRHRPTPTAAG